MLGWPAIWTEGNYTTEPARTRLCCSRRQRPYEAEREVLAQPTGTMFNHGSSASVAYQALLSSAGQLTCNLDAAVEQTASRLWELPAPQVLSGIIQAWAGLFHYAIQGAARGNRHSILAHVVPGGYGGVRPRVWGRAIPYKGAAAD
jgi:hypothetical protein